MYFFLLFLFFFVFLGEGRGQAILNFVMVFFISCCFLSLQIVISCILISICYFTILVDVSMVSICSPSFPGTFSYNMVDSTAKHRYTIPIIRIRPCTLVTVRTLLKHICKANTTYWDNFVLLSFSLVFVKMQLTNYDHFALNLCLM